ncbi:unnamed protein product [Ceutorhynchus assimilis]|uniref:Uncharacterized protein n=1 Tax=Ceutorhynchus assimilis TaxID=467358 RepID=A0A9N9MM91_9CUCU|nr:unnamed protein product [Ceutorhynchus assimilis]
MLTVNFKKTTFMPFTCYSSKLPPYDSIQLKFNSENVILESCNKFKYLGVFLDSHLRWDYHTEYVSNKLRSLLHNFRFFTKIFNVAQLKILYYALAQSHLNYGILAWGAVTNKYLESVTITQKWIIKIILKKDRLYPTHLLFSESSIFDARQLYFQKIALGLFQNKIHVSSVDHSYATRNRRNQAVARPKVSKTIGQRCFQFIAPTVYSKIVIFLHTPSTLAFKYKLKLFLRTQITRDEVHSIIDFKNN